jgi:hypothetical protein
MRPSSSSLYLWLHSQMAVSNILRLRPHTTRMIGVATGSYTARKEFSTDRVADDDDNVVHDMERGTGWKPKRAPSHNYHTNMYSQAGGAHAYNPNDMYIPSRDRKLKVTLDPLVDLRKMSVSELLEAKIEEIPQIVFQAAKDRRTHILFRCFRTYADVINNDTTYEWDFNHLSRALYGLRFIDLYRQESALAFAKAIINVIERDPVKFSGANCTTIGLSKIVMGLSSSRIHSGHSKDAFDESVTDETNGPQEENVSTTSTEIREREVLRILRVFIRLVRENGDYSSFKTLGPIVYALNSHSSEHPDVRQMISLVTDRMKACTEQREDIDNIGLSASVWGLRNKSCGHKEVADFVSALAAVISVSPDKLNEQGISSAIGGLKDMDSNYYEVRDLVTAISNRIAVSGVTVCFS